MAGNENEDEEKGIIRSVCEPIQITLISVSSCKVEHREQVCLMAKQSRELAQIVHLGGCASLFATHRLEYQHHQLMRLPTQEKRQEWPLKGASPIASGQLCLLPKSTGDGHNLAS